MPNSAYHITFRPSHCDNNGNYALQMPKDFNTMRDYIERKNPIKYEIVQEGDGISAHLHCALVLSKNVKPNNIKQQLLRFYAKYIDFKIQKGYNPALQVRQHPIEQINILAGGYHQKECTILCNVGFSPLELKEGQEKYDKFMENKRRKRLIELNNKNFVQKLDDYLFYNDIKYHHLSYKQFVHQIIPKMISENYIFSISPKQGRLLVLQFLRNNVSNINEYLDEWLVMDSVTVDRENYMKVMSIGISSF